jgi:hypothetical protein
MYGLFSKKSIGASGGGIIHIIFNEKGPGYHELLQWMSGYRQLLAAAQWFQHRYW